MTVTLCDDVSALTVREVVEQLMSCGDIELEDYERVIDTRLECGCDLEVDIECNADDVRIDGRYTITRTLEDIRAAFTAADYYTWAVNEDGEDVLLCFGD